MTALPLRILYKLLLLDNNMNYDSLKIKGKKTILFDKNIEF